MENSDSLFEFADRLESCMGEIENASRTLIDEMDEAGGYLLDDYSIQVLSNISDSLEAIKGATGLCQGLVDTVRERATLISEL